MENLFWLFWMALIIFMICLFLISDWIATKTLLKKKGVQFEPFTAVIVPQRERWFEIASGYEGVAILPSRSTGGSAGYDLHAAITDPWVISPGDTRLIPTGIAAFMMPDEELQIRPRSGLAFKYGITVLNSPGTIDSDFYPEPIGVLLHNTGKFIFRVKPGDRIAQAVFGAYLTVNGDEHGEGQDRSGGFGHTGDGVRG